MLRVNEMNSPLQGWGTFDIRGESDSVSQKGDGCPA